MPGGKRVNTPVSALQPGVFGVSHGSGVGGMIIRDATGSWAGHAFLYLGGGQMVEGAPPVSRIVPADKYGDAIWAWQMWDKLRSVSGWDAQAIAAAQLAVVGRGHALVDLPYDWPAYIGFAAEVTHLRTEKQLSPFFRHDTYRVCSALVDDAETFGKVPMTFTAEDGPGLDRDPAVKVPTPYMANLVAPGMLLGLAQRLNWC
jgi:hypothetical protein